MHELWRRRWHIAECMCVRVCARLTSSVCGGGGGGGGAFLCATARGQMCDVVEVYLMRSHGLYDRLAVNRFTGFLLFGNRSKRIHRMMRQQVKCVFMLSIIEICTFAYYFPEL